MYGRRAVELLRELKRCPDLPPYNDDAVRQVIDETLALHEEVMETIGARDLNIEDAEVACGLIVHHQSLLRNKRCLLAFLHHRLSRIQKLRWEIGSILPKDTRENMSPLECRFFDGYDVLLGRYMRDIRLDLTSDLQPPKDLYIEVRVKEDVGEILTDDGPIHLQANTTHYLRRADVEHLVRQGALEHIT